MYNLITSLDKCKTKGERTELLIKNYLRNSSATIKLIDYTKYISELIPIIIENKDTSSLLEIKSVNVMKMVQSSLQLDLILTNPILKDDIQSLLIYLITSNCKNINIFNETDTIKLYKIWQCMITGHKQFKYNGNLIHTNENIIWSYQPKPNEISNLLKKKYDNENTTEKRIYLKRILNEIEDLDLEEFLDYVDTYYEACSNNNTSIFKRLSEMMSFSSNVPQ